MKLTANGITIAYEEFGPETGEPLILIRGLGSQMVHWPRQLYEGFAARGYRTVIFDNRDVGLSQRCPADGVPDGAGDIAAMIDAGEAPPPAYGLDDMALDVTGLMDALGMERAHIFGISMGGLIAQILAARHPGRLLSATIVMSSARRLEPETMKGLLATPETREAHQDSWVESDRNWGSPGFPMSEEEVREQAGRAWDRGLDADGINRQVLAILSCENLRERLGGIALPCLVIHGADDALIPPEAGRGIAAGIPGASLSVIDGMGHVITPALAPLIVRNVDDFISKA